MAKRGKETTGEQATMLLRGANGMLYKIPISELQRYAVPPEELNKALKSLEAVNPLLAAQDTGGAAAAKAPQVVINIYTSAEGGVSITSEGAPPVAKAYNSTQLPIVIPGPTRAKKRKK